MPKFSTNGKVLGRPTQGSLDRQNKQWSKEEDKFLEIAVASGMSVNDVSSRLQRGRTSIMQRKWMLGIEGRFKRAKKQKVKKYTSKHVQVTSTTQLFKLESNVALPRRGATSKNEEARNKIRSLFSQMKPGQSFVIPDDLKHPMYHIAKTEFQAYKISRSKTSTDGKFLRVFRLA